jgi:hypothetical protein
MRFYPALAFAGPSALALASWIAYGIVLFTPLALNAVEEWRWRRIPLNA